MSFTLLICPADQSGLIQAAEEWNCPECGRSYPVRRGVVKFLDTQDSFYEGAYLNQVHFLPASESWYRVWPVWLINNGYLWRVRNNVPAGATVLELGCAGGVAYFARRYTMIGLDLSLASLESASGLYDTLIQADAAKAIPVADESVDAVTSSFFWEHIPPAVKTNILAEVRRILKPGGKLIFLYDVETHNPLMSALRNRSPELYDAEFIERDGHLGYEEPGDNIETFESAGFKVIEQVGLERTPLQSTTVYGKMKKWPKPFSALGGLLHRIESTRAGFFAYIGLLRALDETVGKLLPERWSRMALTVCEKAG